MLSILNFCIFDVIDKFQNTQAIFKFRDRYMSKGLTSVKWKYGTCKLQIEMLVIRNFEKFAEVLFLVKGRFQMFRASCILQFFHEQTYCTEIGIHEIKFKWVLTVGAFGPFQSVPMTCFQSKSLLPKGVPKSWACIQE